jgi:hypothetical protein
LKILQLSIVGLCLFPLVVVGGVDLACGGTVPPSSEVTVKTDVTDAVQVFFLIGVNELEKGNFASAINIFNALSLQTESPRVTLELARALFLDRRYRASKKVFQEVHDQPNVPWAVQENIRAYLEEIDAAIGFVKFGLSLVSDSNPWNFTDSQQIMIAGQLLTVLPPEDVKEVYGIRFSVNAAKALIKDRSIIGYLNVYYSHFEKSQFHRGFGDIGLFYSFKSFPKLKLRAGVEESIYGGRHHYDFPYAGVIFTPYLSDQFRMINELKVGWLRVPQANHFNSKNVSLTTKMNKQLFKGILATGDVYLEKSIADEDPYSYHGGSLGFGLSLPIFKHWSMKPCVSIGKRIYEDVDPFFADRRRDNIRRYGITLQNTNIKVFDYTLEIGFSYEENLSTLPFYSYDKIVLIVGFN